MHMRVLLDLRHESVDTILPTFLPSGNRSYSVKFIATEEFLDITAAK